MTSSNSYKNIKLTDSQALGGKSVSYFNVIVNPIFYYRKNLKVLLYNLRFSKMLLNILTMHSSISKLCNRDFRSIYLVLGRLQNMYPNTTALVEELNPRVRVNNKAFHIWLILKVYLTIKRSSIVAMFHHLIILFALSILRPNAFHLKEFSQRFIFNCTLLSFSRHNQLICQPLTIALRE